MGDICRVVTGRKSRSEAQNDTTVYFMAYDSCVQILKTFTVLSTTTSEVETVAVVAAVIVLLCLIILRVLDGSNSWYSVQPIGRKCVTDDTVRECTILDTNKLNSESAAVTGFWQC